MRLVVLAAFFCTIVSPAEEHKVLDVCEALSNLEKLDGHLVTIRGALGTFQGWWLEGEQCAEHVEVKGHVFVDTISIQESTSLVRVHVPPFAASRKPFSELNEALHRLRDEREALRVTIVGILETRQPRAKLLGSRGQLLGFGHLGVAPAQLLLREVVDITIKSRAVKEN